MPARAAARLTIPSTARSVSLASVFRLANTASLAPASPRSDSSDRLTASGRRTWRTMPPLPSTESCTCPLSRATMSDQVKPASSLTRRPRVALSSAVTLIPPGWGVRQTYRFAKRTTPGRLAYYPQVAKRTQKGLKAQRQAVTDNREDNRRELKRRGVPGVSNTPLQWVVDSQPRINTLAFQVDLWSARGELPRTLAEVSTRKQEIQYSSGTRAGTDNFKDIQRLRRAADPVRKGAPLDGDLETRRLTPLAACAHATAMKPMGRPHRLLTRAFDPPYCGRERPRNIQLLPRISSGASRFDSEGRL
jgi:hypothetical protein